MFHTPVTTASNTLKSIVDVNYQIPSLVYQRYPLYEKSFCTTFIVSPHGNIDHVTGLLNYLQIINPEPIVIHNQGDFYPIYKEWLTKYNQNAETEITFLLDYRQSLPTDEDLIYIMKLFDQKPVHMIIVGEYATLPRIFLTNSQLIYLETKQEFNDVNGRYAIETLVADVFLILDRRGMDLQVWIADKTDTLKYI